MNILIFENEFTYIENTFNYVSYKYFEGNLKFTVLTKSQDLHNFGDIQKFDHVFLDISLSAKSALDGFGILKKIKDEKLTVKKLSIITGNSTVKSRLRELEIDFYPVILKPISFTTLYDHLKHMVH